MQLPRSLILVAFFPLFSGLGCGSDDDSPSTTADFGRCPDDLPGQVVGRECAQRSVPLRWDDPGGQKISLNVVRYRGQSPGHGQLWLLDGGPGGTGATFLDEDSIKVYRQLGLDLYIPQHRGTGHSTPLHCDDPEDFAACGATLVNEWGDGLAGFHSLEAGRDVGFLIQQWGRDNEPVVVLGISYGTYWAQRYLQAFPNQASGVILEGVFPLGTDLTESDALADAAGRSLFDACRAEPDCVAAFGGEDLESVATRVLEKADDPALRCFGPDVPDRASLEQVLSFLVVADLGAVVPGVLKRLDRCNDEDSAELLALVQFLEQVLSEQASEGDSVLNQALNDQVTRTDILANVTSLPIDDLLAAREKLVFSAGAGSDESLDALTKSWPVNYPPASTAQDEHATPVLLMNGGLDLQTPSPWAEKLAPALDATLVEFPYVGHGVALSLASPVSSGDVECALGIQRAFIAAPGAELATTCAANAYTPDVAGHLPVSARIAAVLFGADTPLLGAADADGPRAKRREVAGAAPWRDDIIAAIKHAVRRSSTRRTQNLGR